MELKVKLDFNDYYNFNKSYLKRKMKKYIKFGKATFSAYLIVFMFLLVSILVLSGPGVPSQSVHEQNGPGFIMFVPTILLILLFFLMFFTTYKKRIKKYFYSNKLLQQEQTYNITNETLSISSENGSAKITWDKIDRIEVLKTGYGIFISTAQAYVIPKRCFESNEKIVEFEEILKSTQCKIINS